MAYLLPDTERLKAGKFLIIIPAYNEAENISCVVDKLIREYSEYDYIVVNGVPHDMPVVLR